MQSNGRAIFFFSELFFSFKKIVRGIEEENSSEAKEHLRAFIDEKRDEIKLNCAHFRLFPSIKSIIAYCAAIFRLSTEAWTGNRFPLWNTVAGNSPSVFFCRKCENVWSTIGQVSANFRWINKKKQDKKICLKNSRMFEFIFRFVCQFVEKHSDSSGDVKY